MQFFRDLRIDTREGLITMLNRLYASEIVAAQQYWNHAVAAKGMFGPVLAGIFNEHANEEMGHAATLRAHINDLGGLLDNRLCRMVEINPHTVGDGDVAPAAKRYGDTIQLDADAEADAIDAYTEASLLVQHLYPATYVILASILKDELEHRQELLDLLQP